MWLLVDGNNLAYRNFFAQSELFTLDGRRSGGVHGFLRSLAAIRGEVNVEPEKTCIFWDGGRSKYRTRIYPEYKAGRKYSNPKNEQEVLIARDIKVTLIALRECLSHRPMRQVKVDGVEADDLISIMANTIDEEIVIHSGDKDIHKLVSNKISIADPKNGRLSPEKVAALWGMPLFDKRRLELFRAIVGDASDSIKGIRGIGDKRAAKILPFLKLEGNVVFQDRPCSHNGTQNLIDKVISEEGEAIVSRNLDLMALPLDWDCNYYEPEQIEDAMTQFLRVPESNWPAFFQFLDSWELEEVKQDVARL